MEKRVLLAIVLSFIVLYGYQAMFPPPEPVKPVKPAPAAQSPAAPAAATPAAGAGAAATPADAPALEQTPSASPLVADTAERDVTFENGSVRAVFSTRGGVIKSWRLKKYENAATEPEIIELVKMLQRMGADIMVMVHPDHQYDPKIIPVEEIPD